MITYLDSILYKLSGNLVFIVIKIFILIARYFRLLYFTAYLVNVYETSLHIVLATYLAVLCIIIIMLYLC